MYLARKTLNLNTHDNMSLDHKNLESVCVQRDQDYEKESTAWIFKDGSALIEQANNSWVVKNHYGLHADHEKLC